MVKTSTLAAYGAFAKSNASPQQQNDTCTADYHNTADHEVSPSFLKK